MEGPDTGIVFLDTTQLADVCYVLRLTPTDSAGNVGEASVSGSFRVDNRAAALSSSGGTATFLDSGQSLDRGLRSFSVPLGEAP